MLPYLYFWGMQIRMYALFNIIGFLLMLAHNLVYYRNAVLHKDSRFLHATDRLSIKCGKEKILEFPSEKPSIYIVAIVILSLVQFLSGAAMNKLVGDITPGKYNYFGFAVLAPIIFLCFCRLLRLDAFDFLDAFTPGYAISLVSFKLGCFCAGCCQGTEKFLAIYYASKSNYQFPIQILEALVALGIFFYLRKYRKKASKGTMCPMYLILYSSTRFFTEFLRRESDILWHFKFYHFLCAAGVVIGIIEFKLAKKYCSKAAVKTKVKAHG